MRRKPTVGLTGLMRINYPQVYRIAIALCGNPRVADRIARDVLARAGSNYQTWETDEDAARWFARYSVLCTRPIGSPDPRRDALLQASTDLEITAVIHAIRPLPMQQREAFLLHHGQGMELRQLATAMDCSSAAAAQHLKAAANELKVLTPTGLSVFTSNLPGLLQQLVPPPQQVEVQIRRVVRRRRLSAFIRYALLWPVGLILLSWLGWEGFQIWKMIVI